MSILFGPKSFLLQSCKPSQVGMAAQLDTLYTLERRQRYFHLLSIPVVGIGKFWTLRNINDNKLYSPFEVTGSDLNEKPLIDRTPWYTYVLPLLMLAGSLGYYVYSEFKSYEFEQHIKEHSKKKHIAEVKNFSNAIASAPLYQYFELENSNNTVYLKALESDQQTIRCVVALDEKENYSISRMLEIFVSDSLRTFDTMTVVKADLRKTINEEDNDTFAGFPIVANQDALKMRRVEVFAFPVFKNISSGFEGGKYFALIQNIGAGGTYDGLEISSSNLVLDPIDSKIKGGGFLYIAGKISGQEPQLYGKLKFRNEKGIPAVYDITIYSSRIRINQIVK